MTYHCEKITFYHRDADVCVTVRPTLTLLRILDHTHEPVASATRWVRSRVLTRRVNVVGLVSAAFGKSYEITPANHRFTLNTFLLENNSSCKTTTMWQCLQKCTFGRNYLCMLALLSGVCFLI